MADKGGRMRIRVRPPMVRTMAKPQVRRASRQVVKRQTKKQKKGQEKEELNVDDPFAEVTFRFAEDQFGGGGRQKVRMAKMAAMTRVIGKALVAAGVGVAALAQMKAEGFVEINHMIDWIRENGGSHEDYAKSGAAGPLGKTRVYTQYINSESKLYWRIASILAKLPIKVHIPPQIAQHLEALRFTK